MLVVSCLGLLSSESAGSFVLGSMIAHFIGFCEVRQTIGRFTDFENDSRVGAS